MKPIALVLLLTACSAPQGAPQQAAPKPEPHRVKVLSVACDPNHGRPRAEISIQNIGRTTIRYTKGVISFGGTVVDSYTRPEHLQPNAIGTILAYAPRGSGTAACSLIQVQDGDGNLVSVSR